MEFTDNDALDFLSFQNHTVQLLKQWRKPSWSSQRELGDSLEFLSSMVLISTGIKQNLRELIIMKRQ